MCGPADAICRKRIDELTCVGWLNGLTHHASRWFGRSRPPPHVICSISAHALKRSRVQWVFTSVCSIFSNEIKHKNGGMIKYRCVRCVCHDLELDKHLPVRPCHSVNKCRVWESFPCPPDRYTSTLNTSSSPPPSSSSSSSSLLLTFWLTRKQKRKQQSQVSHLIICDSYFILCKGPKHGLHQTKNIVHKCVIKRHFSFILPQTIECHWVWSRW